MLSRIVATVGRRSNRRGLAVAHRGRSGGVASNSIEDTLGIGGFFRGRSSSTERSAKPSSRVPMRPSTITPNTSSPKRFPPRWQRWHLRDYIRRKFDARRIDVVVADTTPALQFVIRFREELFPRVPIVFVAGRMPEASAQHTAAEITGVLSDPALEETTRIWR